MTAPTPNGLSFLIKEEGRKNNAMGFGDEQAIKALVSTILTVMHEMKFKHISSTFKCNIYFDWAMRCSALEIFQNQTLKIFENTAKTIFVIIL